MTPKWATELIARVLTDEGKSEPVTLTWRRSHHRPARERIGFHADGRRYIYGTFERGPNQLSTGRAFPPGRIVITAGTNRTDQKLVLLHELAHILRPKEHHGPAFWDKAWELYRRYGVPIRYAQKREYRYRKGAKAAYRRTASRLFGDQ